MNALFYFLLIIRRPHRSTPTATLSPYTTLSRSGTVEQTGLAEFGRTAPSITAPDSTLFHGLPAQQSVWMSHGDSVSAAPEGFLVTARTGGAAVAAFKHPGRRHAGVQFHPEVLHTEHGKAVDRKSTRLNSNHTS